MKIKPRIVFKRLRETVLFGTTVSAVATILGLICDFSTKQSKIISVVSIVAFLVLYYLQLRNFRLSVPGIKRYFKYNLVSMAIYGVVASGFLAAMRFSSGTLKSILNIFNTFVFFIFRTPRFFSYSTSNPDGYSIGNTTSAIITTVGFMIFIIIAPVIIFKPKKFVEDRRTKIPRYKEGKK